MTSKPWIAISSSELPAKSQNPVFSVNPSDVSPHSSTPFLDSKEEVLPQILHPLDTSSPASCLSSPTFPTRNAESDDVHRDACAINSHSVPTGISTAHAGDPDHSTSRRPSIQFMPPPPIDTRARRPSSLRMSSQKRNVSPPPPPLFEPRVSFTTFEKETLRTSISLVNTHRDFVHSKTSRRFLCGVDSNEYSEFALQWLFDEMVDDNDEVVCLRVVDKDSTSATAHQKHYRDEAQLLMEKVLQKNVDGKAIQLTLEYAIGRVQEVFGQMIQLHEPMILVVGTKGRSRAGIQSLLPGSISKYALQCSPVPVVVVNPGLVREKRKKKRMLDRSRRGYRDLLDKSGDQPFFLQPFSSDSSRTSSTTQLSHMSNTVASALSGPSSFARRAGGFLSRPGSGIFASGPHGTGRHTRAGSTLSQRSGASSGTGLAGLSLSTPNLASTSGPGRVGEGADNEAVSSSPVSSSGSSPLALSVPSGPNSATTSVHSTPKAAEKF